MKVKSARIKNYRLLKDVRLTLDSETTLIVGRNNTGKTSFAEIFRCFMSSSGSKLHYEDFHQSTLSQFEQALNAFNMGYPEEEVRPLIPAVELELRVDYSEDKNDFGIISDFIIDLDESICETDILLSFQLKDGEITDFFKHLDVADRKQYFSDLKRLINQKFEPVVYAVDPTNVENKSKIEFSAFKQLIMSGLINAQRGLDDETHSERDVLGKSLGNIFKSASSEGAPEEFKAKSEELNRVVEDLQKKMDTDFQEKLKALLPTLSIFGYPGLQDPNLSASTELNVKSLIDSNTRIYYARDDYFTLPETYNGLGVRNLIFILFRIYEFFRSFQSQSTAPKSHLIFIEEPEAHLHPQMQEVFIRQLSQIVAEFQKTLNKGDSWPVQFIVSTHSSHIANEAEFSKVRYFLCKNNKETKVKDLGDAFNGAESKEDREFLHKYLTLTKCDLYFADCAIMIEGATERILLPEMIKKEELRGCKLRNRYMSVIEIGGAYAHHFYKFIDFLELKTLFITDLDAVEKVVGDDGGKVVYRSSPICKATHSSNVGISSWLSRMGEYSDLKDILLMEDQQKISGSRRLAFQVAENESEIRGRSFEDAFILANLSLFGLQDVKEEKLEYVVFERAKKLCKEQRGKANFAIKYAVESTDWIVPKYIREGLMWLGLEDNRLDQEVN